MTYGEYLYRAEACTSVAEADKLIEEVADDWSITARQYERIRYVAIKSAFGE